MSQTTVPTQPWRRVELLECGHFGYALAPDTTQARDALIYQ